MQSLFHKGPNKSTMAKMDKPTIGMLEKYSQFLWNQKTQGNVVA